MRWGKHFCNNNSLKMAKAVHSNRRGHSAVVDSARASVTLKKSLIRHRRAGLENFGAKPVG